MDIGSEIGRTLRAPAHLEDCLPDLSTPGPTSAPTSMNTTAPTSLTQPPTSVPTSVPTLSTPGPASLNTTAPTNVIQLPTPLPTRGPTILTPGPTSVNTTAPTSVIQPPTHVPSSAPTLSTPAPTQLDTPAPTGGSSAPTLVTHVPTQVTPSPTELLTFAPTEVDTTSSPTDITPTMVTPSPTNMPLTLAPTAESTSAPTIQCSVRYEQCGGKAWVAEGKPTTCCSDADTCAPQADNIWYSQCLPNNENAPPSPAPVSGTTLSPESGDPQVCSKLWEQCGGTSWVAEGKPQCCMGGAVCVPQVNNPWYSQCRPGSPTPAGTDNTPPPTDDTSMQCSARYEQCGGKAWVADGKPTTCCSDTDICAPQADNIWYSQCLPRENAPPSPAPVSGATQAPAHDDAACSPIYGQCGGTSWVAQGKPQCCESGSICVPQANNPWYSQCLPDTSTQPKALHNEPLIASTSAPTSLYTVSPTAIVSVTEAPTDATEEPSPSPTQMPTSGSTSTDAPTSSQTEESTPVPTQHPTSSPTEYPTLSQTEANTHAPSDYYTPQPTAITAEPTLVPSIISRAAVVYECDEGLIIDSINLCSDTALNAITSYECIDASGASYTKLVNVGDSSAGISVTVKGPFTGFSSSYAVPPDPEDAASGLQLHTTVLSSSQPLYGTVYTDTTEKICGSGEVLSGFSLFEDISGTMVGADMAARCRVAFTSVPTPARVESSTSLPTQDDIQATPAPASE